MIEVALDREVDPEPGVGALDLRVASELRGEGVLGHVGDVCHHPRDRKPHVGVGALGGVAATGKVRIIGDGPAGDRGEGDVLCGQPA